MKKSLILKDMMEVVLKQKTLLENKELDSFESLIDEFELLIDKMESLSSEGVEYTEEDKIRIIEISGIHLSNLKELKNQLSLLGSKIELADKKKVASNAYNNLYDRSNEEGIFIDNR